MTFRRFTDKNGTDWEVWEVIPLMADRRHAERRATADRGRAHRPDVAERRIASRRNNSSPSQYVRVSRGFEEGWLCFAAGTNIRRLAPIPLNWNDAPSEQLELWAGSASPSWKCSSS